jgi:D-alanine-D-alanine ligase
VGVLAGGASSERSISLATGAQIAEGLPKDRYDVVLLDPLSLMAGNPLVAEELRTLARRELDGEGAEAPLPERDRALPLAMQNAMTRAMRQLRPAPRALGLTGAAPEIDVAFIALHGAWGEDGRIQGLLETIGIPHTGSGMLASALSIDKAIAKEVFRSAGLTVPAGVEVSAAEHASGAWRAKVAAVPAPYVVKPVIEGSATGMSQAAALDDVDAALRTALAYGGRALVEERIRGREVTCGVLGLEDLVALPIVELVPRSEVNDYQAKYDPAAAQEICPARLDAATAGRVQDAAIRAHRSLGCRALSRTDAFVRDDGGIVVLELNTMPGLTPSSLLPKAAAAAGIAFPDLLDRLVRWALDGR